MFAVTFGGDSACSVMHVAFFLVFSFSSAAGRSGAEVRFPVVLHVGWKLFEVGEQRGDLPHVLFAESFVPGGHAGVADAGADGVEDVPLGIVGRIGDESSAAADRTNWRADGLAVEACHGRERSSWCRASCRRSDSHRWAEWVGDARSMTFHGSVDGAHGDAALEVRRCDVGVGGEKAEHGEGESAENEH